MPKRIRDELGLQGGEELTISARDGRIELEIPPREVEVRDRGSLKVAHPLGASTPLTDELVRDTLERVRR